MKRQLREAFACVTRNQYASEEIGGIGAWECPLGGQQHINDDGVVIEVLEGDAAGRPPAEAEISGEAVVTALHAYAMPVLRWRTGDLVRRAEAPCRCGAPFATLTAIEGRRADAFELPDGRRVYSAGLAHTIQRHESWIERYQVEQWTRERVTVRIVPRGSPSPEAIDALRRGVESFLGAGVGASVELVCEIPSGPGKKHRLLWSHLDDRHEGAPT